MIVLQKIYFRSCNKVFKSHRKSVRQEVMPTLTYTEKSWREYLEKFLGHPIFLFVFNLVISLVFSTFSEGSYRIVAVLMLGFFWLVVGIIFSRLKMKEEFYRNLPGKIRYHKVVKEIQILNEEGDANLKYTYSGENLSDTHLTGIFHLLRTYDSKGFLPDQIEGTIDDAPTSVRVESMSKTKKGETQPSAYESKFIFEFPNPVQPRSPLPIHSFRARINGYCKGLRSQDVTIHTVDVLTDNLVIRVIVHDPLVITKWSHSVQDFHQDIDLDEMRKVAEEGPPRESPDGKTLVWEIRKPRLTNRYVLTFSLDTSGLKR